MDRRQARPMRSRLYMVRDVKAEIPQETIIFWIGADIRKTVSRIAMARHMGDVVDMARDDVDKAVGKTKIQDALQRLHEKYDTYETVDK